ncbi:methionine synthase I [Thioclava sp. BHET1]|nr:methionine synthase I [Thioclava sp. BHET1]
MGLIATLLGLGQGARGLGDAARGVAEVFTPNATRAMETRAEGFQSALEEAGAEFRIAPATGFDRLINGLNRLPRPMLALGTLGLFAYAMVAPDSFSLRMQGLALVPEPLWWLLGAVVSFYFGAREAYHYRAFKVANTAPAAASAPEAEGDDPEARALAAPNPALIDWAATRQRQ